MESILIVDDDCNLCNVLGEELCEVGYNVKALNNGNDVLAAVKKYKFDLVLLDLKMPGKNGFEVLQEFGAHKIESKVIVLTAYADVKSAIESAKLGAADFISKPYDFDELLITIRKVLQKDN